MKRTMSCMIFLLLAGGVAVAQSPPAPGDDKEMQDLLSVLQQETAVATRSRLNSDYVPGIVTVLQGDQLAAMGISTAGEALGLVPGMEAVLDVRSAPQVIVRGFSFPFNSGNIQILVNSVPLARPDAGINPAVLLMPIEQVDRIEVIRGPGSVIYGDFAFMGLVNIITKKDGVAASVRKDDRFLGGNARAAWKAGPLTMALNLARANSTDAPAPAPRRHVDEGRSFGIFTAEGSGFTLTAEATDRSFQPGPSGGGGGPNFRETSWTGDLRYLRELLPKVQVEADARYLDSDLFDGVSTFQGTLRRFGLSLTTDRFRRQAWLVAADTSDSKIDYAAHATPPLPGQPLPPLQPLGVGTKRTINGITLQDRIDVGGALAVTLGVRHDDYSDVGSRTTPRGSIVWRLNEHHILKAQYAEGFRPPTFFEYYTPPPRGVVPRYPFETNATTELNYVYRAGGMVGRATLFRTSLSDLLRPGGQVVPGHGRSHGVEVEWSEELTPRLKVDANASHANTRDPRAGSGVSDPTSANWLANVALSFQPLPSTVVVARLDHVGRRRGGDGFDTVDLTLSRQDLFLRGLGLRIGVKNAFDDQVTYLGAPPTGIVQTSLFPGRSLWAQLHWRL